MDATTITQSKGGDVFQMDYSHADVGYTATLAGGSWGVYSNGGVIVGDSITPTLDSNSTSIAGTWKTSVHLPAGGGYTSARVHYEGAGFTVSYTLNGGTTWTALPEDGVISLTPNPDLDLLVTFPGRVLNDPASLTSITIYALNTELVRSIRQARTLSITGSPLTAAGLVTSSSSVISSSISSAPPTYVPLGTLEMWVTPPTSTLLVKPPSATTYVNGVSGTAVTAGVRQHVVMVFSAANDIFLNLASGLTVDHLGLYPQQLSASEVSAIYNSNIGVPALSIVESNVISVTEPANSVDIYAYVWSIVSGSS